MRQGDRPEAAEAGEHVALLRRGGPLLLLDAFEGADGGEDVAGFGFLAAGDHRRLAGESSLRNSDSTAAGSGLTLGVS